MTKHSSVQKQHIVLVSVQYLQHQKLHPLNSKTEIVPILPLNMLYHSRSKTSGAINTNNKMGPLPEEV